MAEMECRLYWVNAQLLEELRPDVIVTQSLCSVCSIDFCVVEKLAAAMTKVPKVCACVCYGLGLGFGKNMKWCVLSGEEVMV
jgi:hypothetical protein